MAHKRIIRTLEGLEGLLYKAQRKLAATRQRLRQRGQCVEIREAARKAVDADTETSMALALDRLKAVLESREVGS